MHNHPERQHQEVSCPQEKQAREQAERLAEQEQRARVQAERQAHALAERLRALGIDPDTL